ncbi:MAG: PemK family transcriptional regulator [Candidatus Aminicenantes bacterium RBG_13_59_9]|jgi:mRNA interferase MazF|nr:MAG: PemK family transcriptional regulator [Candidatus Aminicenantes bacterium RBG_13_59_9]
MVIAQGDVFWLDTGAPRGSGPGFQRPHVVVQNDVFNSSRINTTVLCALTSNLTRAKAPGNLLLRKGEANLPRPSVVNVSQVVTVDKFVLKEKIGTLSRQRVDEIVAGLRLVLEPRDL